MTEEQGRIKCARCQKIIKGIPFELRMSQSFDTMRLMLYFCSLTHVKDWIMSEAGGMYILTSEQLNKSGGKVVA